MKHIEELVPTFVEFIPQHLEPGVLYISKRFSTASHLCCCGCGLEVVTPLNPAKWSLTESQGAVSLRPSIGNWSFPCRSHYWINGNRVQWAAAMSPERIAAIKARDRRDVEAMTLETPGLLIRVVKAIFARIGSWFGR